MVMTNAAAATAAPELVVLSLALEQLTPSPTNPRKHFDEGRLDELAASMQTHGILQALVVRPAKPSPHLTGGTFYEIVAGERRFRAAKRAGLTHVPAVVRQLTDLQVLEAQLIENGQRDDIHPIEAADTFAALQKLDGSCNAKVIATKIGKSERYVQNVLHYAVLVPKAKQAFLEDHINAGHADLIARLKPADQERALKACFDNLYGDDEERGAISVRSLDRWIKENVRLDPVADAPQLPELQKLVDATKGDAAAAFSTVLQVSGSYSVTPATKGLMGPNDYRVVQGKKDVCGHMRRALLVIGDDRGKLIDICTARTSCKVHWKYEVERLEQEAKGKNRSTGKAGTSGTHPSRNLKQERERADAARQSSERRDQAKDRAVALLRKATIKPGPDLLKVLVTLGSYGQGRTWGGLVADIVENDLFTHDADWKRGIALLRPLGIKLDAIEKELLLRSKGITAPLKKEPAKKRRAGKKR